MTATARKRPSREGQQFVSSSSFVSDDVAQRVGEIFYELRSDGVVTPEAFVARARAEPKRSEMVKRHFDGWDAGAAAEKQWLDSARMLMRSFSVLTLVKGEPVKSRGAYYVPASHGYLAREDIRANEESAVSLVDLARREIVEYFQRYSSILDLTQRDADADVRELLELIRTRFG